MKYDKGYKQDPESEAETLNQEEGLRSLESDESIKERLRREVAKEPKLDMKQILAKGVKTLGMALHRGSKGKDIIDRSDEDDS